MNQIIGLVGWVFANGPGDLGSIPGRVIPKTLKMVLDISLLNTQHYKGRIKGKVEQSKEWCSALPRLRYRSYRKGSFLVALDYGCQLYSTYYDVTVHHFSHYAIGTPLGLVECKLWIQTSGGSGERWALTCCSCPRNAAWVVALMNKTMLHDQWRICQWRIP